MFYVPHVVMVLLPPSGQTRACLPFHVGAVCTLRQSKLKPIKEFSVINNSELEL